MQGIGVMHHEAGWQHSLKLANVGPDFFLGGGRGVTAISRLHERSSRAPPPKVDNFLMEHSRWASVQAKAYLMDCKSCISLLHMVIYRFCQDQR